MALPPARPPHPLRAVLGRCGLGLLVLLALACGPQRLESVPPDLLGVWRTRAPRYRENFFEVRRDSVVLGVTGLELDVLPILEIDWRSDRKGDVYRFHYLADEGYEDFIVVTRVGTGARAIRLASQADLWTPGER